MEVYGIYILAKHTNFVNDELVVLIYTKHVTWIDSSPLFDLSLITLTTNESNEN